MRSFSAAFDRFWPYINITYWSIQAPASQI